MKLSEQKPAEPDPPYVLKTHRGIDYRTNGEHKLFRVSQLCGFEKQEFFEEWRKRVSFFRQTEMMDIGTAMHERIECAILGDPFDESKHDKYSSLLSDEPARLIGEYLRQNYKLDDCLIEQPLFCPEMMLSGTSDLITRTLSGRPKILDFKVSKRKKTREDIEGYLLQVSTYILMWNSLTEIETIEHGEIIIAFPEFKRIETFSVNMKEHRDDVFRCLGRFAKWVESQWENV